LRLHGLLLVVDRDDRGYHRRARGPGQLAGTPCAAGPGENTAGPGDGTWVTRHRPQGTPLPAAVGCGPVASAARRFQASRFALSWTAALRTGMKFGRMTTPYAFFT